MRLRCIKILSGLFFIFIFQPHLLSYSNEIDKAILNNIVINEYDNNNISVGINSDRKILNHYEVKQHNDVTTIILPLTQISRQFEIEKCSCNNLVKDIEIQYLPYLNKNSNSYGYTKIKLYTNPQIQVICEFDTDNISLSSDSAKQTTIVKKYVTNLKKTPKKFKSKNIMPIIDNVSSKEKDNRMATSEKRRYEYDLNLEEEKLNEYKNSPIKFPAYKEIQLFISKHILILLISFILVVLSVVVEFKKKRLGGKIVKVESNKINSYKFTQVNEDNFLDFLEELNGTKMSQFENYMDIPEIENNGSSDEAEAETYNEIQFKKFLVDKVMSDITSMDFNDLSSKFNEDSIYDNIYDNILNEDSFEDPLTISFNEFILENQTPKFNISQEMTQLYNLNNFNELTN